MSNSPAKKKSVFSPSPSKKAKAGTGGKPTVKFLVYNQNTYKSGLVCIRFDQGCISEDLRAGLKKLTDQGKIIVSFNSGKKSEGKEGLMEWSASLPPPLHTRARHSCRQLTHIRRANVPWYQDKNAALNLTSPPKRFMRLVQDFIEKEDLATFEGAELEDGAPVNNINEIIFAPIAGLPADFPKLEKDVKSIAEEMAEIKDAVLRVGKVVEALAQHDPTTPMTEVEIAAAAGEVDPVPDVQDGQFGSPVKTE